MPLSDILYYRTHVRIWQEEIFSGIARLHQKRMGGEEACGYQEKNGMLWKPV